MRPATDVDVLVVDTAGMDDAERQAWNAFVGDYARARSHADASRTALSVVLLSRGHVPPEMNGREDLEVMWWWGALGRVDLETEVRTAAPGVDPVLAAQIVEVAGFDIGVVHHLMHAEPRTLEDWKLELAGYAAAHSLDGAPPDSRDSHALPYPGDLLQDWDSGLVDAFCSDPFPYWHSSLYALSEARGDGSTPPMIAHRLWKAGLRTIFPRLVDWHFELARRSIREKHVSEYREPVNFRSDLKERLGNANDLPHGTVKRLLVETFDELCARRADIAHQKRNYASRDWITDFDRMARAMLERLDEDAALRGEKSPVPDSNRRPLPYHGSALPTELTGREA